MAIDALERSDILYGGSKEHDAHAHAKRYIKNLLYALRFPGSVVVADHRTPFTEAPEEAIIRLQWAYRVE